jgi:lipopolysaccharide assembly outer membrane protein LptD (OstA)
MKWSERRGGTGTLDRGPGNRLWSDLVTGPLSPRSPSAANRMRRIMKDMNWILAAFAVLLLTSAAAGQGFQEPAADQGRLQADRVRYDAKQKVFTAEGNVHLVMGDVEVHAKRARVEQIPQRVTASGDVLVVQRETSLRAAEVIYEIRPGLVNASGEVYVAWKDVIINAPALKYNVRTEQLVAQGGVKLAQSNSILTAHALDADLRAKRAEATGNAKLVRAGGSLAGTQDRVASALAQEDTTITAARMTFRWDTNEARAFDGVTVTQPDKTARAKEGFYSETAGRIELQGDVVVEQLSGEWLVKGKVIDAPTDDTSKKALASKTTLTAARLVIELKARNMLAEEDVTVTQQARTATGNRATYTDKDKVVVVTGNVRMRDDDGSWLRADRVVISLIEETFEALGNVETEFRVKRGK